jgi:hypothetical protein
MSTFQDRVDARRKTFKKGVDADDARRRREDENVQLRKAKRDEQLSKKRLMRDDAENTENEPVNVNLSLDPGMAAAAAKLKDPATDTQTRLAVVTEIRKQLSRAKSPPIQEAINAVICPLAVQYLGSDNAKLQFEASWVLTNIASGESHQTQAVVDAGGLPAFLEILRTGDVETKEQVVWAMANIAGDSAKLRNHCLQAGTMDAFLGCLVQYEGRTEMLKHATWGISNLLRGKPKPHPEYIQKAMPYLCRLLGCSEPDVLTDALWALSYIADGDENQINILLESGVVGTVVQALGCGNDEYGTPAIRVVGNIATGSHQQTQVVLSCGALTHLPYFLHAKKSNLVKEACWLLSNVTAGTPDQIQAVMDAGLLSKVLEICGGGSTHLIRKEAFWTVANLAVGGRPDQIHVAVDLGLIKALVEGLSFQGDAGLICAIIDGLSQVLKVGAETSDGENRYFALMEENEGSEKLEQLQEDQNEEVYQRAVNLLQKYCEVEDGDGDAYADAYQSDAPAQFNFA